MDPTNNEQSEGNSCGGPNESSTSGGTSNTDSSGSVDNSGQASQNVIIIFAHFIGTEW